MRRLGDAIGAATGWEPRWVERGCVDCQVIIQALDVQLEPRCDGCAERVRLAEQAELLELQRIETAAALERQWVEEQARQALRTTLLKDPTPLLAQAGVPKRYSHRTRASWEAKYGLWPVERRARDGTTGWFMAEAARWPRGWTIDGWETPEAMDGWAIVLSGGYGLRKTSLAVAIMGELLAREMVPAGDCLFIDHGLWLREMAAGRFARRDELWQRAATATVLTLDDLGVVVGERLDHGGRPSTWWKEETAEVIRYREMHVLPTLFTINGTVAALGAINPSLPSRLNVPLQWTLVGKDHRHS